jgi:hypothetical protein
MVPLSGITIAADAEHLTYSGFSLGEPIRLGNFKFITNYFDSLSLSLEGRLKHHLHGLNSPGHQPCGGP